MVICMCKMISPGVFSVFQNFDFLGRQGGVKGQKIAQKDKTLSVKPYISGTIHDLHV